MVKHNNQLVKNHFKKDWERHVKTWFNQPARKFRRRQKRLRKAASIYPRPLHKLHPLVHGQTLKYQAKIRLGRGFSHQELKLAKIDRNLARTIGITVDHRRRNRSFETRDANVQRLTLYMSKLILFPRKSGAPKKGDATPAEMESVVQQKKPFPYRTRLNVHKERARAITEKEKTDSAYLTLRKARGEQNKIGDKIRKERKEALGITAAAAKADKAGKAAATKESAAVVDDDGDDEEGGKKGGKGKGGKKDQKK